MKHILPMKKIFIIFQILFSVYCFGQNKLLNDDGTISDDFKRQYLLELWNKESQNGTKFSIENNCFVIITKYDCGDKKYEPKEMQERALNYCFYQLLDQITHLKHMGYESFSQLNFEGIIFKTNTICMSSTKRYTFKFSIEELNNFPEYMDFEELCLYVVVKNKNRNIIYSKN